MLTVPNPQTSIRSHTVPACLLRRRVLRPHPLQARNRLGPDLRHTLDALPHLPRSHGAAAPVPGVVLRPHLVFRPPQVDVRRGLGAHVHVYLPRRLRIRGLLDLDVLRALGSQLFIEELIFLHGLSLWVVVQMVVGLAFIASSMRFAQGSLDSESQSVTGATAIPYDLEGMILYVL
jgi:hypothetical protein